MTALLAAEAITKSYAGVRALSGVSFDLQRGEVHALVGENGAGKSTLIKIMTGAVAPDSGTLTVDGRLLHHVTPAVARGLGIAAIYQQPSLFPQLTVAENIAIAVEPRSAWRRIAWGARRRAAGEILRRVGAEIDADRLVESLSMPEQQLVEIAKAVGTRARILIMDEPTASLSDREVERLFEAIARLRAEGAGIIYISHRLEEVLQLADRVTVLRDGRSVGTQVRVHRRSSIVHRPSTRDDRPTMDDRRWTIADPPGQSHDRTGAVLAFCQAPGGVRRRGARAAWRCRAARPACATCRSRFAVERSWELAGWSDPAGPSLRARCLA